MSKRVTEYARMRDKEKRRLNFEERRKQACHDAAEVIRKYHEGETPGITLGKEIDEMLRISDEQRDELAETLAAFNKTTEPEAKPLSDAGALPPHP